MPTNQPDQAAAAAPKQASARVPAATARREALSAGLRTVGGVGLAWLGLSALIKAQAGPAALALRPPGALPESDFMAACVRCGLCVRGCPYDVLKLARMTDPAPLGTPFFTARDKPCLMCPEVPCAKACPTGALNRKIGSIREADMGVAVLVGHETCLNYKGLACSICVRVCPIKGEAITLQTHVIEGQQRLIPTVHSDQCTGCGNCEKNCVIREAAIRVLPRPLGLGKEGRRA